MAKVCKIWMSKGVEVLDENEGTVKYHYRIVFKQPNNPNVIGMTGFLANSDGHAARMVRKQLGAQLPVIEFVRTLREAL